MNNSKQPAFPIKPYPELNSDTKDNFGAFGGLNPTGLTKREYFAAMAMQGMLANSRTAEQITSALGAVTPEGANKAVCYNAVLLADELLKNLDEVSASSK